MISVVAAAPTKKILRENSVRRARPLAQDDTSRNDAKERGCLKKTATKSVKDDLKGFSFTLFCRKIES